MGTRNPRHFRRGELDGKILGIESTTGAENVVCRLLSNLSETIEIPAEYLLPVRPEGPGQMVIFIGGDLSLRGQQRKTFIKDQEQWMMEQDESDVVALVMDEQSLARIWNVE